MNIFERRAELIAQRDKKNELYWEFRSKTTKGNNDVGPFLDKQNIILDEVNSLFAQVSSIDRIIVEHSYFSPEEIMPALEDIISCSEGRKYSFNISKCIDARTKRDIYLVVLDDEKKDEYTLLEIEMLKRDKKALVFSRYLRIDDNVGFYVYDTKLENDCNLDDFPFVKSFVHEVICYKDDNEISPYMIGSKTINKLKDDFVLRNVDNFVNYHALKDQRDEEKKIKLDEMIVERKTYQKKLLDLKKANTDN